MLLRLSAHQVRHYSKRNLLELRERHGFIHDIFPPKSHQKLIHHLNETPRCLYAGFDPTAESLHVGNLLVIMALLRAQRAGHQPLGVIGGATAKIGDPSGKTAERNAMSDPEIDRNVEGLRDNLQTIFRNHQDLFWTEKEPPLALNLCNNADWYDGFNIIDFLRQNGRHFRMAKLLSRDSIKLRMEQTKADPNGGLSFTEFTYQVFQAYDWYHLYKTHGCTVQIGGADQMGNVATGHEFITRIETALQVNRKQRASNPTFGLFLPLVTTQDGKKLGKSDGAPVWLSAKKTSPFDFYQYFLRIPDSDVETFLHFFTFLPTSEIRDLMDQHQNHSEKRIPHQKLAEQLTLLVHGETGLRVARNATEFLYGSGDATHKLAQMSKQDVLQLFPDSHHLRLSLSPGFTVLDLALKCFPSEKEAVKMVSGGGFYINQQRASNIDEMLMPNIHILANNVSLIRIGKRNYIVVEWCD